VAWQLIPIVQRAVYKAGVEEEDNFVPSLAFESEDVLDYAKQTHIFDLLVKLFKNLAAHSSLSPLTELNAAFQRAAEVALLHAVSIARDQNPVFK